MPRWLRGRDGKFAGSVGDGKTNTPTPAPARPGALPPLPVVPDWTPPPVGNIESLYSRYQSENTGEAVVMHNAREADPGVQEVGISALRGESAGQRYAVVLPDRIGGGLLSSDRWIAAAVRFTDDPRTFDYADLAEAVDGGWGEIGVSDHTLHAVNSCMDDLERDENNVTFFTGTYEVGGYFDEADCLVVDLEEYRFARASDIADGPSNG